MDNILFFLFKAVYNEIDLFLQSENKKGYLFFMSSFCSYRTGSLSYFVGLPKQQWSVGLTFGIHFPPRKLPQVGHLGGLCLVTYVKEQPGLVHVPWPRRV